MRGIDDTHEGVYSPMRGIDDAAGGVLSASRSNSTKKATKMFIPVYQ